VLRVLGCVATEHDYRLVLLAALICAATAATTFHTYSFATHERGARRAAWVFLAGVCGGAGIWATHFVAMLAYSPAATFDYDPVLTIVSLLIAASATTLGFLLSVRGGRAAIAAGGALIGAGIGLMHFTGMRALVVPGTFTWDWKLAVGSVAIGIVLASAALLAWHQLERSKARWVAPALLTLAICGLHFTAMGAATMVPDPNIAVHPTDLNGSTLAIAITAVTMLVMLALLAVTLITSEGKRDALLRNQELVDAALEGLVVARDGIIVNINRRLLDLTLFTRAELLGIRVTGDLVIVPEAETLASHKGAEGLLKTASGRAIPVEVVRQSLTGSERANEVYAIRDLTDWRQIEAELRGRNKVLQDREEELRTQNRRFEFTLSNMRHGLCMIDPDQRIVVCNKRYVEMYGLPPNLVTPGAPIREVFEYRVAKGLYAAKEDEEYRSEGFNAMLEPTTKTRRLSDGRVILISRQPTGGGGWIAIHDDITEREQLNARLERQNLLLQQHEAELQTQNANLDIALANMSQGLAMYDGEERLVIANQRYAEIYGLEAQHLCPGTPLREIVEYRISRGLYPGVTVDEVLANMRERVARGRASHLVSRPGDGRVLSVSIQPRSEGGWVVTLQDITERERLNARLVEQNALLQQREEELGTQNARFDAAIGNMSQGMCLYDSQERIVFANKRYAEIYGLTPDETKPGTTLRQIYEARAQSKAVEGSAREKFVLEGLQRSRSCRSEIIRLSDGRLISVVRRRMPGGGLLSTHEDITEREQLNSRFDAAISNMSQGMCLYDAQQRVVFANDRFAEIYGLTREQVKPGTTPRQILEARAANGNYGTRLAGDLIANGLARFKSISSEVVKLMDGRLISVVRRPMPDGGLLSTHEDVTEREQLSDRLAKQNELLALRTQELNARNEQLDAAMGNMLQGLAMYDSQQRLVMCNKHYTELYALPPGLTNPGTTLRAILEHRIARGEYVGKTADELLRERIDRVAGQKMAQYVNELNDGRHIAVSIQPMADGGTVTTHHDITEQRRSEAKIAHMALHDTLTGLPNRVLLNDRLEDALQRVKRGEIVATLLLDLDHFKTVNDTLGHPAGDKLLKAVSERLRSVVRESDTIARMGGDEFAIVQTAIAQPADATALAYRIIDSVGAPYVIEGHQVVIGTSVGIAVGPSDGTSPDQLMRNADLALYRAKGDGRGTYRFFEHEMDAQMQVRRAMEYDLRKALAARQFELHYQVVLNLASNEVSGFEALVRWHHPGKGLVSPAEFIPLAEEMGFIVQLGEWAIREACATAAKWPGNLNIAVNLSPAQFRSPGLVQVIVSALAASGLPPERLELEITEGTLLQDSETTLSMLYQLRALGVRIVMDDFGTGYSSLSYLQSFPFDKIKIDRSFVRDIADGVGSLNIVRAVAALAKGFGMATTAEGVETKEQLDILRAEGCTEMQGYLFSKPLPASEIAQFLRQCAGDMSLPPPGTGTQGNAADAA
jgi:diguanylate cyclase (GGDEF)-like protein/PAS domain S-box-containing protein